MTNFNDIYFMFTYLKKKVNKKTFYQNKSEEIPMT